MMETEFGTVMTVKNRERETKKDQEVVKRISWWIISPRIWFLMKPRGIRQSMSLHSPIGTRLLLFHALPVTYFEDPLCVMIVCSPYLNCLEIVSIAIGVTYHQSIMLWLIRKKLNMIAMPSTKHCISSLAQIKEKSCVT